MNATIYHQKQTRSGFVIERKEVKSFASMALAINFVAEYNRINNPPGAIWWSFAKLGG